MFKFGVVGVVNSLITLSIIFMLMKIFNVSYIISNVLGYLFGIINSFIWNKKWTFQSSGNSRREMLVFFILFGVCYLLQLAALVIIAEVLGVPEEYSQVLALAVYTVTNFMGNKFITFK